MLCCAWSLSHVQLFETLWAVASQAPLSSGFSRKEYWSELPFPPPGDIPDPGIEPVSLTPPDCRQVLHHLSQQRSPGGSSGRERSCQCRNCKRRGFDPWMGKILWRRGWQPTPVFLPGESHGQRRLSGYSPWGRKELATE